MIKILASDGMEKSAIAALQAKGCQVDVKFYEPDALCEAVKDYDVLVEGNTDNVPVSTTSAKMKNIRNNWDLSALRAASVVQYLQDHFGVNPKRLTAGGRGEYNPVTTNDTEVGKQRNRRTQIIITPKLDQFMDLIDKAPEEK